MIKKVFITIILSFFTVMLTNHKIFGYDFISFDNFSAIKINEDISIYKNNILINKVEDSQILDLNDKYLLYNNENQIYLYDMNSQQSIHVHSNAYNGKLSNEYVIFESDFNNEYICKNLVETIKYRNCYKLYKYDIESKQIEILDLVGMDNYLNDINDNFIAYNSIHNIDDYCLSVCSFINLYDIEQNTNKVINKYHDLFLEMSGNAHLDGNVIYFESIPNIYSCNYSQIFLYDIYSELLELVTFDGENCFHKNSEILNANEEYMIFKSNYNNYQDDEYYNYIYSYKDKKYSKMSGACLNKLSYIQNKNINCLIEDDIYMEKIDSQAPTINTNIIYTALKEQDTQLIDQLEYTDNLSSKENMYITIITPLDKIGEQYIELEVCDNFNNCSKDEILVNIIDKDITAPKIYCIDVINIKVNTLFNINDYGYAIDNVDGRIELKIVNEIDLTKKGRQSIVICCSDSSENIAYKEIELVIYDDLNLYIPYFATIIVTSIIIAIIYILRFKKSKYI